MAHRRAGSTVVVAAAALFSLTAPCTSHIANAEPNQPAPKSTPASAANPQPPALRLPPGIRPLHYALDLTIVPAREDFSGIVTIDLRLDRPTDLVWLNARDLTVEQATIRAGHETQTARVVPGGTDFVGFALPQAVPAGAAQLIVRYRGKLDSERSRGIYRAAEGSSKGADDWYAYTFFESIDARRAFPCFDEPSYKVPWRLSFHVKQSHVALANAPVVGETPEANGMKRVDLAESKPLPSYLVAFVVGPFELVDDGTAGRKQTPIRFIIPRGRSGELAYAKEVTPRIVKLLEDYPDLPYPYDKLDVAVVPRFWGTMEHPGIVALGQPLTLIKPDEESLARRQTYANIAIHELGHYWFGDYVTCRWWDDVWLNESFGTWFDTKLTNQLEPTWKWALDSLRHIRSAMSTDALASAPPLRRKVESIDAIEGAFENDITYFKGYSLLRMIEHWLGEEPFRAIVRRYLRDFAWKNASADDWIHELEIGAGADVAQAFRSFVDQPGVPLVTATARCDGGKPRLELAQRRFWASATATASDARWHIPLCARLGEGKTSSKQCTLLKDAHAELPLDRCPTWVMPNADGAGYYRSAYDAKGLRTLMPALAQAQLDVPERLTVVDDLRALTGAGRLTLGETLTLLPTLLNDPEPRVLHTALGWVQLLHIDEQPPAQRKAFGRFVEKRLAARARSYGWHKQPNEDPEINWLRSTLWWMLVDSADDADGKRQVRKLADAWLADHIEVDNDLAPSVLLLAARDGDAALFERVLTAARQTHENVDRLRLFQTLGGFRDPALLERALALLIAPDLDLRDTLTILTTALYHVDTREAAWRFTQQHFDELTARMRTDETVQLVTRIAGAFCDETHRQQTSAFLRARTAKLPGTAHVLDETYERVDVCIANVARDRAAVAKFLAAY